MSSFPGLPASANAAPTLAPLAPCLESPADNQRRPRVARPTGWHRIAAALQLDWLRIRPATPASARDARGGAGADAAPAPVLVAYATQTGCAEQLARDTLHALRAAGVPARLAEFENLTIAALAGVERALFVVSTTCDGDPPDMAETFSRQAMRRVADLAHLRYGLLALGDRATTISQAWLSWRAPSMPLVAAQCLMFNLGNAGVIAGTLCASPRLTAVGTVAFVAALLMFLHGTRGARGDWALRIYRALLALVATGATVGLLLSVLRPLH